MNRITDNSNGELSAQSVARLSLYRRVLGRLAEEGRERVYSHELASLARASAAVVRRDLMVLGCSGNSRLGYDLDCLVARIEGLLDAPGGEAVALVGAGKLGRSILAYFADRRPNLRIVAAFDVDPWLTDRTMQGTPCYRLDELPTIATRQRLDVGIVAVPAEAAQVSADALLAAGVRGILNFAPVSLRVPEGVYVEDNDITTSLERVAYFARARDGKSNKEEA